MATTHSKYYATCKRSFEKGNYTIKQVYMFTTLEGKSKLTDDEFFEITGISVEEYLSEE